MSKLHIGGKESQASMVPQSPLLPPPNAPPSTAEDGTTVNVDDPTLPRPAKSLKELGDGGDRKTATGGALAAFVPAVGAKPTNFFELLAAAFSSAKLEQSKGPDFLEYLKKSGIKMAWVRAIVALYEEQKKPDDPLAYIVKLMGLGIPEQIDVKQMQDQVVRLRVKLLHLQDENVELKQAIEDVEVELRKKEDLVSLYEENKYFSDYNSDDDYSGAEQETQQQQQQYQSYSFSKQY